MFWRRRSPPSHLPVSNDADRSNNSFPARNQYQQARYQSQMESMRPTAQQFQMSNASEGMLRQSDLPTLITSMLDVYSASAASSQMLNTHPEPLDWGSERRAGNNGDGNMKRLSGAQRKQALKSSLEAKGIKWEPYKWRKKKAGNKYTQDDFPKREANKSGPNTSTPTSSKASAKKVKGNVQKREGSPLGKGKETNAEGVNRIKLAIVPCDYPSVKVAPEKVDEIKEALIDAFELLEDGYFPQFAGSYLQRGALIILCSTEHTKSWVEAKIPNLQLWEGIKLIAKSKDDVFQGTKIRIKVPKVFARTGCQKVLETLKNQNESLKTDNWLTVNGSGQNFTYMVDAESLNAIKALNNKVYLGLGTVDIVVLDNDDKNVANQPSVE